MRDDGCDLLRVDAPRAQAIRRTLVGIEEAARDAAERARAFSDPNRLAVVSALMECEELCVCDLAWISGRSQNLVSHHLRALLPGLSGIRERLDLPRTRQPGPLDAELFGYLREGLPGGMEGPDRFLPEFWWAWRPSHRHLDHLLVDLYPTSSAVH